MAKSLPLVIFVLLMMTIIVAVDVLFFRNHFWERLIANITIVLVFIALFFVFFNRH